jgi:4-hydroxy-3-methylbut-2-enyl diphosphate reductase
VHGKPKHEETRATFSHAAFHTPTVVVNDIKEAIELGKYISGDKSEKDFYTEFKGRYSEGFDITKDLQRIGVVNQTTMLASDTQAIADHLKQVMKTTYGLTEEKIGQRFADTRDTLCYATNDNQTAVYGMLQTHADLAVVVGGYNSSNTSHLVELCEAKLPTYFIDAADKIISSTQVLHYNFHSKEEITSTEFLPGKNEAVKILITSGASCPDAVVEDVIEKILMVAGVEKSIENMIAEFQP